MLEHAPFIQYVQMEFAFLEHAGYHCVVVSPSLVEYVNDPARLLIVYDRRLGELDASVRIPGIGKGGMATYSVCDIMMAMSEGQRDIGLVW
jgi:hypothetical protein